jgi:Two component regulator propeller
VSAHDRLRELLPSLYRPEPDEGTLGNRLLGSWGLVLDGAAIQLQHVLRAHWFDLADKALWDAHYQTARSERGQPAANVRNAKDVKEILQYPYITDLARVGSLLNLPPWLEPAGLRESVEEYRQRVSDVLDAYQLGLTTLPALRRLTEAALPEDMGATPAQQRWPFAIEQPVAIKTERDQIAVPDAEEGDLVSPLFRWTLDGAPGSPVVYIQGVAPSGDLVAATEQPGIERFTPDASPAGMALIYLGTLAPDQTLRLSPARRSWLALDGALQASVQEALSNTAQDPSSNGAWAAVEDPPAGQVRLLAEGVDHTIWMVTEDAGTWALHRYDGTQLGAVTQGAPAGPYLSLRAHGDAVYAGTQQGLFRCALFPAGDHELVAVAAVPEPVHGLTALPDGRLACASGNGLALLKSDDTLDSRLLAGTEVRAAHADGGQLYLSTAQALLLKDGERWFRYEGAQLSEEDADWIAIEAAQAGAAVSPLPAVHAIATTPDGNLWLGTARGLARYYVYREHTTLLEAFPDLGTGEVTALLVDERGMLWVAGEDGLFRYDGRDVAQQDFAQPRWMSLGQADTVYPDEISATPRGHWRYDSTQDQWERFEPAQGRYAVAALDRRNVNSPAVAAVLLTASVRAEIGQFDGSEFSNAQAVGTGQIVLRVKPDEMRIVEGGFPALPSNKGTWRYVQREQNGLTPPAGRPWWSREGRLFPPPEWEAPWPAHFRNEASAWHADGHFDQAVFAYPPSARLWMEYPVDPVIGVRVRLFKRAPDEAVDPALIERVWQLLKRAKAAGVPLQLALEGAVVKGE